MDDEQIRDGVLVLATAFRELATLLDHAELESLADDGPEAQVLLCARPAAIGQFSELAVSANERKVASGVTPWASAAYRNAPKEACAS